MIVETIINHHQPSWPFERALRLFYKAAVLIINNILWENQYTREWNWSHSKGLIPKVNAYSMVSPWIGAFSPRRHLIRQNPLVLDFHMLTISIVNTLFWMKEKQNEFWYLWSNDPRSKIGCTGKFSYFSWRRLSQFVN